MSKRWWFLLASIIVYIVFLVVYYYFFLAPTNKALQSANDTLDAADQVIKTGCRAALNSNTNLITIAPETRLYCQQVLAE